MAWQVRHQITKRNNNLKIFFQVLCEAHNSQGISRYSDFLDPRCEDNINVGILKLSILYKISNTNKFPNLILQSKLWISASVGETKIQRIHEDPERLRKGIKFQWKFLKLQFFLKLISNLFLWTFTIEKFPFFVVWKFLWSFRSNKWLKLRFYSLIIFSIFLTGLWIALQTERGNF